MFSNQSKAVPLPDNIEFVLVIINLRSEKDNSEHQVCKPNSEK